MTAQTEERRETGRRAEENGVEMVDILVAEGDERQARLISDALSELENRVTVLAAGRECREYLTGSGEYSGERRAPDLVIVDEELLGEGCFRFLTRMVRQEKFADTEFALLVDVGAGEGDDAETVRRRIKQKIDAAYEAGVHYTIRKPVDFAAMQALVAELQNMGLAVVRRRQERRR